MGRGPRLSVRRSGCSLPDLQRDNDATVPRMQPGFKTEVDKDGCGTDKKLGTYGA
jgi:hypothetical protein